MTDEPKIHDDEHYTGDRRFRRIIGYLCIFGSLAGFLALFFVKIPPENKDAMMLALGIIFGWGGAVVSSEYGVTTTGRKVAESAIRKIERADIASEGPLPVEVVNTEEKPANVQETKT